jgi:proteic killer suppression protein
MFNAHRVITVSTQRWIAKVLNAAQNLDDLRSPPGNRLEPLKGNFKGFHSIRINSQWQIVFSWDVNSANEVHIVDYH